MFIQTNRKMMKHLYIMNEYESSLSNGIGTYIRQLLLCLSGTELSIGILLFNSPRSFFDIEEKEGIWYYHFPPFPDKRIQEYARIIDKFLRLYIPDMSENFFLINYSPCSVFMETIRNSHPLSKQIYVIHDMAWTSYFFGDVDRYVRMLKQRKRNSIRGKYSFWLDAYEETIRMCQLANRIVCLSNDTYRLLSTYYPIEENKLCLIPNALFKPVRRWSEKRKKTFRAKMLLPEEEKILLYVGRLTEQKGFMVYIEAFKEIVKQYPQCRLVVIGSTGNWDFVRKLCYPVLSKIYFTGTLLPEEVEKWYQIADIGVLPSYTEQCSYVGLEMLAHHLPIVASDGFGMRCLFQEQANIRVAHIGNVKQLNGYKNELVSSTLQLLYLEGKEGQGKLGFDYQRKECMKELYLGLLDA